jgi:hypothetical protein
VVGSNTPKRLSEPAWDALQEALSVFYWYKSDLGNFLRAELQDHPKLLARVDFGAPKRQIAGTVVAALRRSESQDQHIVVDLLIRLSDFDPTFPRLARLDDGAAKVAQAREALVTIQRVITHHRTQVDARASSREERDRAAEDAQARRAHTTELHRLRDEFFRMAGMTDAHARGKDLEVLLNGLFVLWDLDPKAAYSIDHEQIDGAFTFRTDDYLLEARWWKDPLQPKELNDFKTKVESKARNTLGLCVSINGFTDGAITKHSVATPLMCLDGEDLLAVLEDRIGLDEVLTRKRRHAATTGNPMFRVRDMLG